MNMHKLHLHTLCRYSTTNHRLGQSHTNVTMSDK